MSFTIAMLLAALSQIGIESHDPSDIDFGCTVYATLADSSGTGLSRMGDWDSVEQWCGGILGTPPSIIVSAELFMQGINQDRVRDWSVEDLDGTFRLLDGNGDGVIERGEVTATALAGEAPVFAQAFVRRTARLLLLETADADRNGIVSASERAAMVAAWTQAKNKSVLARAWIDAAKFDRASVWSPISPGASFAAFESSLDGAGDGSRIDWLRMAAWFHARDRDGDRALNAAELYASGVGERDTETAAPAPLRLASEARLALERGDVEGAVQRLVGLAWLSPKSLTGPQPDRRGPLETAHEILSIALPAESQPMTRAFRLLNIPLHK